MIFFAGNTIFYRTFTNPIRTKDVVWTSEPANPNSGENLVVGPGQIITKEFNFNMPIGDMTSFGIVMGKTLFEVIKKLITRLHERHAHCSLWPIPECNIRCLN